MSSIELRYQGLNSLTPAVLGSFVALTSLDLSHNKFALLPVWFLSLVYTWIASWSFLQTEICTLTTLNTLDVSFNQLTTLPSQLGQLTSLKSLYLYDNPIRQFPSMTAPCWTMITWVSVSDDANVNEWQRKWSNWWIYNTWSSQLLCDRLSCSFNTLLTNKSQVRAVMMWLGRDGL